MTSSILTARCDELTAVVTSLASTSRLSVPLFHNGNLQSTLTHRGSSGGDLTLLSLAFTASGQHLCGLVQTQNEGRMVVVWNVTRGVVVYKIEEEEDLKILDMTTPRTNDEDSCFVLVKKASEKLYVQDYSLTNKLKMVRKIKAGKVDDDDAVLQVAASGDKVAVRNQKSVKVLQRESGEKLQKIKLSSEKGGGRLVMDEKHVVACTPSQLQVFSISDGKSVMTVALSETPSQLQVQGSYLLLDQSLYAIKKRASVVSTLDDTDQDVSVHLSFCSETEVEAVVDKSGIEIYRLNFINEDGGVVDKIALPKEDEAMEEEQSKSAKRPAPSSITQTLGPGQAGAESMNVDDRPVKKSKTDGEEEAEEEEPTIAERLKRLEQALAQEDEEDDEDQANFKPKQATTESLSHLLHQALESSDDSMLELALGVRDAKIRQLSVDDLSVDQAALFLNKLTARLAKKPSRAAALVPWIQSLLMSGKIQSSAPLMPLRNLVQERIEVFPQLLQLEGRLSILANM